MNQLHEYWIKPDMSFYQINPPGMAMGCGITAHSVEDAMEILKEVVYKGKPLPPVRKLIEDVEFTDLDPNHVMPNMPDLSVILRRGVWFPSGYSKYPEATKDLVWPIKETDNNPLARHEPAN